MAIKIKEADVAQRTEQGSSKAKAAGSIRAVSASVHAGHCNQGDYFGSCKYGQDDCPAIIRPKPIDDRADDLFAAIIQKNKERLAYNAAYQRDLRTIKRLGLDITVAAYRKSKET